MKKRFLIFLLNIIHLTSSILIRPKDIFVYNKGARPGECPNAGNTECHLSGTLNYKIFECDYDYQCPISYKCCWEKCLNFDICKSVKINDGNVENYEYKSTERDYTVVTSLSPESTTNIIVTSTQKTDDMKHRTTTFDDEDFGTHSDSGSHSGDTTTSSNLYTSRLTTEKVQEIDTKTSTRTSEKSSNPTTKPNDPFDDTEDDEDYDDGSGSTTTRSEISTSENMQEMKEFTSSISTDLTLQSSTKTPINLNTNPYITLASLTSEIIQKESSTKTSISSSSSDATTDSQIIFTNSHKSEINTPDLFDDTEDSGDDDDHNGSGNYDDDLEKESNPTPFSTQSENTSKITTEVTSTPSISTSTAISSYDIDTSEDTIIITTSQKSEFYIPGNLYNITTTEKEWKSNTTHTTLETTTQFSMQRENTSTVSSEITKKVTSTPSMSTSTKISSSDIDNSRDTNIITTSTELFDDTESSDDDDDDNGSGHYDDDLEKEWKTNTTLEITTEFRRTNEVNSSTTSMPTDLTFESSSKESLTSINDSNAIPVFTNSKSTEKIGTISNTVPIFISTQNPKEYSPENTTDSFDNIDGSGGDDDDDNDDEHGSGNYSNDIINESNKNKEWKINESNKDNKENGTSKQGDTSKEGPPFNGTEDHEADKIIEI